jgi:hypothetical protein
MEWSYGLFQNIKVVPVSISYEYDPTDVLKIPQLLAEANNEIYIKKRTKISWRFLVALWDRRKEYTCI